MQILQSNWFLFLIKQLNAVPEREHNGMMMLQVRRSERGSDKQLSDIIASAFFFARQELLVAR